MIPDVLAKVREAIRNTSFAGNVFLVGGAVRDELLGLEHGNDYDLVTTGDALALARLLRNAGLTQNEPVVYPRFGTSMLFIDGCAVELVTARRESYDSRTRKPSVEPASYLEDAQRRDFTVNTLLRDLTDWQVIDPLGVGQIDLQNRILRTPLDPGATFVDDPLRMLRAIRFRWQLKFKPAENLYEAIAANAERITIVSFERIRDELIKMFARPTAPGALRDLVATGLSKWIAPEFDAMVGVEQGDFHHLDVWDHTLLVIENLWNQQSHPPLELILAALFHDIGKPSTQTKDDEGRTRFFGHESTGAAMTATVLRRWKFSEREIEPIELLVRNHMRLGSSPTFSDPATRRLLRDMGDQLENLFALVEADVAALKPGVKKMDVDLIRRKVEEIRRVSPVQMLESPLNGADIMRILGIGAGEEVGRLKSLLLESVLEGKLDPADKEGAERIILQENK